MPPFRTYLVLSIVFFLVLLFDPKEEFGILFEPGTETAEETVGDDKTADEIREELLTELAEDGLIPPPQKKAESSTATDTATTDTDQPKKSWDGLGVTITPDDAEATTDEGVGDCDLDSINDIRLPDWLARRMSPERLLVVW